MPDFFVQATANSSGIASLNIDQNNPTAIWVLEQISVNVGPNSTNGNVSIFKNLVLVTSGNLVPAPDINGATTLGVTAGQLPYLYLGATDHVIVVLNSLTSGDRVTCRVQYREFGEHDPAVAGVIGGG